jgi:hypothetical protein
MKIPYGESNFAKIRTEGYFYVDKTPFLPVLEDLGESYLLFLRPRRMGKSLFLSLLEHYYDLGRAPQFDALFGGLWIHEHPTPKRNAYLVLTFDFSMVNVDGGEDALREAFLEVVRSGVQDFLMRYRERVPAFEPFAAKLDGYHDAAALMANLLAFVRGAGHKLYVLIDEYDNFANRLLSGGSREAYEALVARTGFVRSFYATLKAGTASGAVDRMFVTGVAPLLLDDMSSGFNIAAHISQSPRFNTLTGFTRADVERSVGELLRDRPDLAAQPELGDQGRLLDVLERYYDGYRFSVKATERVFNSDMVLYFLRELDDGGTYPTEMLDLNARTDYRSLQHIGMLTGTDRDARRSLLETIALEGGIQSRLERQFGVGSLPSETHFISLLYYLGMLTLAPEVAGAPPAVDSRRLEIPNRVIRELQWEHLATMLQEETHTVIGPVELESALSAMAQQGDIAPFLDLFHTRVIEALGVKDLRRFDEKSVKLMMLTFISLSHTFYPLSEKEMAQGFCDLFLGVSTSNPSARFAWLLELKYLPTGAKPAQIEKAFAQAGEQVARYAGDERLVPLLTQGKALKAGSIVFIGAKRALFRPWPPSSATPAKTSRPRKAGPMRAGKKR